MLLRVGYDVQYDCSARTPMVVLLTVHHRHAPDMIQPDVLETRPAVPVTGYRDAFGNWCSRLTAPGGTIGLRTDAVVRVPRAPDPVPCGARLVPPEELPSELLTYVLGSRYCETDLLTPIAWERFGHLPETWDRVAAVNDFVHQHVAFDYLAARSTKTAFDTYRERTGVCRDFAHLGLTLCRALNIPARYCTGYLGDIDVPPSTSPMDFSGWFEVYVEGGWYVVDPRNHVPRSGRVLIARGRDAADVPLTHSFGVATLRSFTVWTDEIGPD